MKKETKTKLLVTLAVLGVWVYIEVEPVLSQNGGPGFFNQAPSQNPQGFNGNFSNQQNLIPQGFPDQGVRSQQFNQGTPVMPLNGQGLLPRRSQIEGRTAYPTGQMQGQGQQMPFMPTNSQFQPNSNFGQMAPPQMPQQNQGGLKGMFQNMFNNQRQNQPMPQAAPNGFDQNPQGINPGVINQAVSSVQQEFSIAQSNAAQAEAYRSQAISLQDKGAKRRAAAEARYYANLARAAAARAQSKSQGVPQAMTILSQVKIQASRAQSAADSASSYASGW